jgi:undecaprenyl-diphosphatase
VVDFLFSLDLALFYFVNHTLSNSAFDLIMPWLTDINQHWMGRGILLALWLFLFLRGGISGRTAALLLIPTFIVSDQLSSSVLKFIFDRPRPCHSLSNVQLLVPCGSGYSFPSSHAVNAFAAALVLSHFIARWSWAFFTAAGLLAFSRLYVGVHYPSDVLGGAVIGLGCGWFILQCHRIAVQWWSGRNAIAENQDKTRS